MFKSLTGRAKQSARVSSPALTALAAFAAFATFGALTMSCAGSALAAQPASPVAAARNAPAASATQTVSVTVPGMSAATAKALAQFNPTAIQAAPLKGLWEVVTQAGEVIYVNEDASLVFTGSMIQWPSKRNLTQERQDRVNAIDFATLPIADAIVHVRGAGQRKMAVLADPNCGFCKRLENDLLALDNVTIYTFLLPVLGEDSVRKSHAIWCSSDRAAAWSDWMLKGVAAVATKPDCVAPLERIAGIARSKRVTGTPLLVFSDSTRVPGAIGLNALEQRLATAAASGGKPKTP